MDAVCVCFYVGHLAYQRELVLTYIVYSVNLIVCSLWNFLMINSWFVLQNVYIYKVHTLIKCSIDPTLLKTQYVWFL